ncbi:ABC transporter substrate-binding protein [Acidisphaera sp. L21]|jgi:peptide/nickel transport system substrate-binding protein|uniref:ABC transporter substrate-binding protein n=1 Tax=Acidisphaera sp. L21 TaxID=1641851 RepID=UPI00131AF787|nr:ABC transporter substrate-binding protein [Acidisphaera sp. L21]
MTDRDDRTTLAHLTEALRRGTGRRDLMRWLTRAGMGAMLADALILQANTAHAQTAKPGGKIRVASQSASTADTLDPVRGTNTTDYSRAFMCYNGLTRLDGKLVPQPELAETFTTTDAKVWTFKLRAGITFHDGSPLTPADVVYTINRVKDPKTGSSARALATQMTDIAADGPSAVRITLSSPNADLPVILGTPHFMIVKDGTTDFSKGNGTGPYTVKEFSPGVRSIVVKNPNYWKPGKPYLDEIEYFSIEDETARVNAMLAGDITVASQIGPRVIRRIKATPGYSILETASGNYNDFIFRQDSDPTKNQDLVLAIKYLFDREQMQNALGGVVGNDQPVDPSNRYFNAALPQRPLDLDKAKFHFAKSGLGNTALPLYVMAGNVMTDQAVILQQTALGIGMNIDIQRMPKDGYWANVWMKHPFTGGNINPRPSADSLFTLFFKSDSAWNESAWNNPAFDKLLIDARGETDDGKRKQMYGEMQTMVADKGGIGIPLFSSFYDAYSSKLKGLTQIPTGGMMGFGFAENVWLDA